MPAINPYIAIQRQADAPRARLLPNAGWHCAHHTQTYTQVLSPISASVVPTPNTLYALSAFVYVCVCLHANAAVVIVIKRIKCTEI